MADFLLNFDGEFLIKLIVLAGVGFAASMFTRKFGFAPSRRERFRNFMSGDDPNERDYSRFTYYLIWIGLFLFSLFAAADMPYFIAVTIGAMINVAMNAISDYNLYRDHRMFDKWKDNDNNDDWR